MNENPTKFHKSMGNVKDDDVSDGEIRLLQALVRDCEGSIVNYRMKEIKAADKIKKIWEKIKPDKELAQESRIFVDEHPLFEAMCVASGITPEKGKRLFYKRVEDKIKKRIEKRKENARRKKENNKKKKSKKANTSRKSSRGKSK